MKRCEGLSIEREEEIDYFRIFQITQSEHRDFCRPATSESGGKGEKKKEKQLGINTRLISPFPLDLDTSYTFGRELAE